MYQLRATVFHRDIQTRRRENTTRRTVFLTKFEVFSKPMKHCRSCRNRNSSSSSCFRLGASLALGRYCWSVESRCSSSCRIALTSWTFSLDNYQHQAPRTVSILLQTFLGALMLNNTCFWKALLSNRHTWPMYFLWYFNKSYGSVAFGLSLRVSRSIFHIISYFKQRSKR